MTIIQSHTLHTQLHMDIQEYMAEALNNNAILNIMEDGVIILSPELIIRSLNPSAELYLGYATEEVSGQKIGNVLIGSEDLQASFRVVQTKSLKTIFFACAVCTACLQLACNNSVDNFDNTV